MLRSFEYKCNLCGKKETRLVDDEEREIQRCECGIQMQRIFSVPNVRTDKLSASYVDGQRGRSKEFMELKRQNQLEDTIQDEWSAEEDKTEAKKELETMVSKK